MTDDTWRSLRSFFERYVGRFRGADGALDPALELKYRHSLRVADDARTIAAELGLSSADTRLAEACGLLHDIGRFPQLRTHGSFRDADTVDHGAEGRRVLEAEGLRCRLAAEDWAPLATAVEHHNRRAGDQPSGLGSREETMLRLVRDADKLDIVDIVLRSIARDGFQELPEMLPHIRLGRGVSRAVVEEVSRTRSVSLGDLSTLGDFLVMLVSWFHDLNYPPTRRLAASRDLLGRIGRELPDTEECRAVIRAALAGSGRAAAGAGLLSRRSRRPSGRRPG